MHCRLFAGIGITLSSLALFGTTLLAADFTNTFSGVITLDGDISDFFDTNGVPLEGVCVQVDTNTLPGNIPGLTATQSAGINESPSSAGSTVDATVHPSGFNQRRIMTAFNPNVNGGTLYIGIDLPGGTGSAANISLANDYGGGTARGQVRPFDADGNGEADFIGRDESNNPISSCIPGQASDLWSCLLNSESDGGVDDPRGRLLGEEEFYNATVTFGGGQIVTVIFREDNFSAANQAELVVQSVPALPIGAVVSSSTGGTGTPLGFDVEIAITNLNNALPFECDRFVNTVVARSGSNSDGSGQGEDVNVVSCAYTLPTGVSITKVCPPTRTVIGTPLVFTGVVSNTGPVGLTNVVISDIVLTNGVPMPTLMVTNIALLTPHQAVAFTGSYIVPIGHTNCTIVDTVVVTALNRCNGELVSETATAECGIQHLLTLTCPTNIMLECLDAIPPPNVNLVTASSTAGGVIVSHLGDEITTNGCVVNVVRRYGAIDACEDTTNCTQLISLQDLSPPLLTCGTNFTVECGTAFTFTVPTAMDQCSGTNVTIRIVSTVSNALCGRTFSATRVWEAVDACTNRATCSQTITVVDTTPPTLVCQTNLIVECGAPFSFTAPTGSDLCDGTNITIRIVSTVTNATCPVAVTRVWEAVDSCTNTSRCTQTISVTDNLPPQLTCATNRIVECGTPFVFDAPMATDSCAGTNVTIRIESTVTNFLCGNTLRAVRTWVATDPCTNSVSCSQTITVVDTTPPTLVCQTNLIVECGTPFTFTAPTGSDLCDGTNITIEVVSTETNRMCGNTFTAIRTWRGRDACTNQTTCSQMVIVVDTTPPMLVCQTNRVVECGTPFTFTVPAGSDLCDGTNITIEVVSTETNRMCGNTFTATRTWRARDGCTNQTTCSQTITVVDTTPPMLVCQTNILAECGAPLAFTAPTGSDLCDGTNITIRILSTVTNATCPVTVTRVFEAVDSCTNTSRCTQTISVMDSLPPQLICAPDRIFECGTPFAFSAPMATDLCAGTNVTVRIESTVTNFLCGRTFRAVRTWVATDPCTNSASCSQTITVVDTTPPTLSCAANLILECGKSWTFSPPTGFDLCDGTNITIEVVSTETNLTCGKTLMAMRTWRATDACTNVSVCSQMVIVVDTTPPTLTCPPDRLVECGSAPLEFGVPTAFDICDGTNVTLVIVSTETNRTCGNTFSARRTWRATDSCTNSATCSQTITVVDTQPPTLTCPPNQIVECGKTWDFALPRAFDLCDGTNITIRLVDTVTNATCGRTFMAMRTWTATDSCTNVATCSQMVMVVDTTPPTLTCASDRVVECGGEWNFAPPNALDLCDGTNLTIRILSTVTNLNCGKTFTAIRTWSATDTCTNVSTCSQTIRVIDSQPPTLICAPNQVVDCGSTWNFTRPGAVDSCDGTNVTITIVSTVTNRTCGNSFSAIRTWSVTDTCTNTSTCSQTVSVVDANPPSFTCPSDRVIECGTVWSFGTPTAVDNCDGTNVTIQLVSTVTNSSCGNTLTATRSWRVADSCTNVALCSQTITVVDTTPPTLSCAANLIIECGKAFQFTPPTVFDLCGGTNVTITIVSTVTNGTCGGTFMAMRTWRAVDACTNAAECSQMVMIVDTTAPAFNCPADRFVECGTPWTFGTPTAVDLCSGTNVTITLVSTVTNTGCGNTFTATRTWRATDTCTNVSTCSQTISVVDTAPPIIACPASLVVECGNNFTIPEPSAIDFCDGTNVTLRLTSAVTNAACGNTFTVTRSYEATDRCTNRATCVQVIRVVDTTPPTLICSSDRSVDCGSAWVFATPTASDQCGTNVTLRIVSTVTNALCGRTIRATRTWEATDVCTNRATCSQTITEVDLAPPVLSCASDRVVECGIAWTFTAPVARDDCDGTNITVSIVSTVTNALCGRTFSAMRIWRASDACTNAVMCSQTIMVVDTTPPTLACAADRLVECGIAWNFSAPSAADVCDGTNVTVTIVSTVTNRLCGRGVSATRTWRATDSCTNVSTCSQTIMEMDTTPPTLACAADRIVECGIPWNFTPPTVNDKCDGTNITITIVNTITNQLCGSTVSATRTWRVTDACTNSSTCSQTVMVIDTAPPSLVCGPNQTVECGTQWTFTPPTFTDLCAGTNVTIAIVSTVTNPLCGTTFSATRTWRVTDACTNSTTCNQTITLVDTLPPTLVDVPADRRFDCIGDVPGLPVVHAEDACNGTNVAVTVTSVTNGTCPITIVNTWTATDRCGNTKRVSQVVTVLDRPPVLTGPTNVTACVGERVTFCVTANAPCAVLYQWFHGGMIIAGATNQCFSTNASFAAAGEYCVMVSGPCSSAASCATLTVLTNVVATGPTNTVACAGTDVSLCTMPSGPGPFGFQWYRGLTLLPAETGPCLLLPSVSSAAAGVYTVVVTGRCGSVTNMATVSLLTNVVAVGPTNAVSCVGDHVNLCVASATGTGPITYSWSRNGVPISGQTANCLSLDNLTLSDAGQYCVVVRGLCGAVTNCAQVDVLTNLVVFGPTNQTVCPGTAVTFCVTPSGSGPFTYQWLKETNLIANATNQCLPLGNVTPASAGTYCVRVSGRCGSATNCATLMLGAGGSLVVTNFCPATGLLQGMPATFSGVVSNAGTVTLNDVVVFADGNLVKPNFTLAPGSSMSFTYPRTPVECDTFLTSTVVATAFDTCGQTTITNASTARCFVNCITTNMPCIDLIKTADRDVAPPGTSVTYTYKVINCGGVVLTNIVVVDDNGTPSLASDDFIVATNLTLAVGQMQTFTRTVILPMTLCSEGESQTSGFITTEILPNGNIKATFVQAFDVNDNTYGVNSVGWGNKEHKFSNLTGSDQAEFAFRNANGQVVLGGRVDYISASSGYPSGYGTLGVTGGDGKVTVGSASSFLSFSTSLTENLNKQPFLSQLTKYTVDSPAASDPNSALWENRMIYTVVVDKNAFGASGFGSVSIVEQHNSPGKRGVSNPTPCNQCVTNIAVATVRAAGQDLSKESRAIVCLCTNQVVCVPLSPCVVPYPFTSANPLTSVEFNESEVLRSFVVSVVSNCMPSQIRMYYNDEHAMVLGIRRVLVKTSSGMSFTDYPVTPLGSSPDSAVNPSVGSTILTGDQAGTDVSGRPIFPALFISDITDNPSSLEGDWQFGGTAIPPHAVFGTWKAAVRFIDKTRNPPKMEVQPDDDPAKNDWNLDGGDPAPSGLKNEGFGAEVRWEVAQLGLTPGRTYRMYFMVHDGDQNKEGGDTGHACAILNPMGSSISQTNCMSSPPPPSTGGRCPEKDSFWKKNTASWPAPYRPNQTVVSVFAKAPADAATDTLLQAVDGKAGSGKVKDLLRQAVTALLNAATPGITYPFTVTDIVEGVNMALMNGSDQALKSLTDVLKDANEEKNCQPSTCPTAALTVNVECQNAISAGQPIQFHGTVRNSGSVAVTNVTISANQGVITTVAILQPGQTNAFTGSFQPTVCGTNITTTVTASGTDTCAHRSVTASGSAACFAPCAPGACLKVTKLIACLLPNDQCGTFGKLAMGYVGETSPGFCYSITISNCGSVALTNLTVVDDKLGDLTQQFGLSITLGPNQGMTRFVKMAWDANTTNTVVASARGAVVGAPMVSSMDSAVAVVRRAALQCVLVVTSTNDLDGVPADSNVQLPADGKSHVVTYRVVLCNAGGVALSNVTVDLGVLVGQGCTAPAPVNLAVSACVTNTLCTVMVNCTNGPVTRRIVSNGFIGGNGNGNVCGFDFEGQRIQVRAECEANINCAPANQPGVRLRKRGDRTMVGSGGSVTYTYTVENTGTSTLTNIQVIDDNATPDNPADDVQIGTISSLGAGQSRDLTRTLMLPVTLCSDASGQVTGSLYTEVLSNGNYRVTFVQATGVNDNTYGANALGWGGPNKHQFNNLVGSDEAEFQLKNSSGQVVLQFKLDYISASTAYPARYGTLGVTGGDGKVSVGSAAGVLAATTSLTENLNKPPFLNNLNLYTVDSPALSDPNSMLWEYRMIYSAVIDRAAFGTGGLGSVAIVSQHNSPSKIGSFTPEPCDTCLTNVARVIAHSGTLSMTNTASATVCVTNGTPGQGTCPTKPDEFKKNTAAWPAPYTPNQTVLSVFSGAAHQAGVSGKTLLQAVDGKGANDGEVKDLLKEAVAGVLNASKPGVIYPFTAAEVIDAVNMAFADGRKDTLRTLRELLKEANENKDCDKPGKP